MQRASLYYKKKRTEKTQHTHQPDLRADQHVRHLCSQPEGGLQPAWNGTWEGSCAVAVQLFGRRLPKKTPTAADQSQRVPSGSDVGAKPRSTGAGCQTSDIAVIEFAQVNTWFLGKQTMQVNRLRLLKAAFYLDYRCVCA